MRYQKVSTIEQLESCMRNQIDVDVWFGGEIDLTSKILSFNEYSITFKEGIYLRNNIDLRARGNYFLLI
ncbi:hypothetical protein E0485_18930 [Paenibacillus albiflavus]|uniref:Uncharacterized protein n=1 Tax=Paenibacillus albiflavus TaxID=2545760 RepID=A0A4R4EB03_9BACL|nr:hypothetical protein [Paenibacillus albiflavus]TCZ75065.1 hypothetical protein E0485_18930 [Paenibacillus albiflavus]